MAELLKNGYFENGRTNWNIIHHGNGRHEEAIYPHPPPVSGHFFACHPHQDTISLYQDVNVGNNDSISHTGSIDIPVLGHVDFTFSIYFRAIHEEKMIEAVIWDLSKQEQSTTGNMTIRPGDWERISISRRYKTGDINIHTIIRCEIYMKTPGADYHFDSASLLPHFKS